MSVCIREQFLESNETGVNQVHGSRNHLLAIFALIYNIFYIKTVLISYPYKFLFLKTQFLIS